MHPDDDADRDYAAISYFCTDSLGLIAISYQSARSDGLDIPCTDYSCIPYILHIIIR